MDRGNENNQIRQESLHEGDYVLVLDSSIDTSYARIHKFTFRWLGLYQVYKADNEKGIFKIRELDDSVLATSIIGSRLKKHYPRGGIIL